MFFSSELLKGTTRQLVLAVLQSQERYGYDIIKAIADSSKEVLTLGEGSVYPLLHALERDGLLASRWVAQEKGPDRKYYRLTPKGVKAAASARQEWKTFATAVQRVLEASA